MSTKLLNINKIIDGKALSNNKKKSTSKSRLKSPSKSTSKSRLKSSSKNTQNENNLKRHEHLSWGRY
jgi:hypothetical protein